MNKLKNVAIITSSATITSHYTYDSFTKTVDQITTNYETLRIKELNIQKTVNNITTDLMKFTYTYDSNNNITSITRYDNGSLTPNYVEYFYYDDLTNALIMHELMVDSDYVITSYTYDERGNITNISRDTNGVTSTIALTYLSTGWLDQLQTITKGGVTYNVSNYQTIGNPLNYRGYTVTYDQRSITGLFDGINTYLYSYNANGIRTSKTVNGVITTYKLEDSKIIQEVKYIDPEDYDGNIILDYYYDSNDNIIGFNYNGVFYQYIKNLQNDIIAIADRNGTILVKYVYDAYGNILSITDTSGIDLGNINPFRFKSYYYDTETGFYYLNSRYYDTLVGRFINADDIAYLGATGSAWSYNLFAYCENNPVMFIDLFGSIPNINLYITDCGSTKSEWKVWAYELGYHDKLPNCCYETMEEAAIAWSKVYGNDTMRDHLERGAIILSREINGRIYYYTGPTETGFYDTCYNAFIFGYPLGPIQGKTEGFIHSHTAYPSSNGTWDTKDYGPSDTDLWLFSFPGIKRQYIVNEKGRLYEFGVISHNIWTKSIWFA